MVNTGSSAILDIRVEVIPIVATIDQHHPLFLQPNDTLGFSHMSKVPYTATDAFGVIPQFTECQYNQILTMLDSETPEAHVALTVGMIPCTTVIVDDVKWIVDSGASRHMVSLFSFNEQPWRGTREDEIRDVLALQSSIFNEDCCNFKARVHLPFPSSFFKNIVHPGFEPEEKKYKVFATTTYVGESYTKNKVFTLCIDESWRETKRIRSPIFCKPRICINGVIYRFVFHRGLIAIAAFDVKTENSKLIALGNVSHEWHNELIELKGKLEVVVYEKWPHGHIHLQVLGQTQKKDEWESHTIHFPSTWKDIQPKVISPCTSGDGEIVFIANLKSAYTYETSVANFSVNYNNQGYRSKIWASQNLRFGLCCYSNSWLDSVNGLFCVWKPSSAAIFNPSTKEVKFPPDLNKDYVSNNYSLDFEPEEKKYKVVLTNKACSRRLHKTLGFDFRQRRVMERDSDHFPLYSVLSLGCLPMRS
ncbi:hypothetical protein MTR67_000924 [Solanum verrucosum]|uniref:F-box associated beta-propeller type 3 domain-containing protein n=1 Tax=Solanum verrucosum TaxID=315347 RepID=A0AAF0T7E1_SOLVR|nr:hypothetical protein MTR67_000924 [Solanum verrucosum]